MKDWRLFNEDYFRNISLHKVKFPSYWKKSYDEKNKFYLMIYKEAKTFVDTLHRGEEFLEGESIRKFWHAHCDLCTLKITIDEDILCYCTDDFQTWICSSCFNDFKGYFNWSEEKLLQ